MKQRFIMAADGEAVQICFRARAPSVANAGAALALVLRPVRHLALAAAGQGRSGRGTFLSAYEACITSCTHPTPASLTHLQYPTRRHRLHLRSPCANWLQPAQRACASWGRFTICANSVS